MKYNSPLLHVAKLGTYFKQITQKIFNLVLILVSIKCCWNSGEAVRGTLVSWCTWEVSWSQCFRTFWMGRWDTHLASKRMSLFTNSAVFLILVRTPLTPPPVLRFEHFKDFLTDSKALYTALRLDNIRHRSEETMSNITLTLNNCTLKESFCVNFK